MASDVQGAATVRSPAEEASPGVAFHALELSAVGFQVSSLQSSGQGQSRRVAFAAFMDCSAKFEQQALYWARSLLDSETVETPCDVHLFMPDTGQAPPEWAMRVGIKVLPIAYWDVRHPYCNKIGLWQERYFGGYSHVCFTDCDLFFVRRPQWPATEGIAAAVVDHANPRWERLAEVFTHAGIPLPEPVSVRWPDDPRRVTAPGNCNGGLYFVARQLIGPLGAAWARWARWLLDTPAVGSPLGAHVDQVAMALALTDTGREVTPLPRELNVPTHIGKLPGTLPVTPTVLHYHSNLDDRGHLCATGRADVDGAIADANRMIECWIADGLRVGAATRGGTVDAVGSWG